MKKCLLIAKVVALSTALFCALSCATTSKKFVSVVDFSEFNKKNTISFDKKENCIKLDYSEGDNFVLYDKIDHRLRSFVLEADVDFPESVDIKSAALIFGFPFKESANVGWCGANVDSTRIGRKDAFRVFGPGFETQDGGEIGDVDLSKTLHLAIDVKANGDFVYQFGNKGSLLRSIKGRVPSWQKGGYVGILTWNSSAIFSNISLQERSGMNEMIDTSSKWEVRGDEYHCDATDNGDSFFYFDKSGRNFVYSSDVTFVNNRGAAALLFRVANKENHECYAANVNTQGKCKLWRWQDGEANQLLGEIELKNNKESKTHNLKVVAFDSWLSFFVDGEAVGSTGDFVKSGSADFGQNTAISEGNFGLLCFDGEMIFKNVCFEPLTSDFTPVLSDVIVSSEAGESAIERKNVFVPTEPVYFQYVKNEAKTVSLKALPEGKNVTLRYFGSDGTEYPEGKNIPVAVGANYLCVESCAKSASGSEATVVYRVNVHRRKNESEYYNEQFRNQFHYSVKDGWGNDPNGMVHYNGVYHLFHQFYDGKKWGPMHWLHLTSTDLLHWKEEELAFTPDANGSMFSGCAVIDKKRLVAFITENGNGQRIKLAFSDDGGKTWKKDNRIVLDWTNDPLNNRDFRDPKVFRWEGQWFMAIAGGPFRIYSSKNLVDWKCESTYAEMHTECPDFYPIKADDGKIKWVLSRGGRLYKVGDFKKVDGAWKFVPDEAYRDEKANGVMNFGRDSYAAMTYYECDFGSKAKPNIPTLIELNWMNTWDDYCNSVAEKVGQDFNGTYNLHLALGLKKCADRYVLTQKPIEAYKALRGKTLYERKNETFSSERSLLGDFGDCYEIVATLRNEGENGVSGFDLRAGENEKTTVRYDWKSKKLTVDRSESGIILSDKFAEKAEYVVEPNESGSLDLHIFVDRASVELFANDYTAAAALQIFPKKESTALYFVSQGAESRADIEIFKMNSIWK